MEKSNHSPWHSHALSLSGDQDDYFCLAPSPNIGTISELFYKQGIIFKFAYDSKDVQHGKCLQTSCDQIKVLLWHKKTLVNINACTYKKLFHKCSAPAISLQSEQLIPPPPTIKKKHYMLPKIKLGCNNPVISCLLQGFTVNKTQIMITACSLE